VSDRATELAEQRAALLLRAAVQRREVAREVDAVEGRLHTVDHYLAVGRRVLLHPIVIASAVVVIALIGRGRAFRLLGRAMLLTRGIRGLLRTARGRI
jgi:YqjK-like protein